MGYIVPPPPTKKIVTCAYCGRAREDDHFNCSGCGAPYPMPVRKPRKRPTPKVTRM